MTCQMFLGNEDSVYILDKAEGNDAQINGHPAWGALWYVTRVPFSRISDKSFCIGMSRPTNRP